MTAAPRLLQRALLVSLAISTALHLAAISSLSPRATPQPHGPSGVLAGRLAPAATERNPDPRTSVSPPVRGSAPRKGPAPSSPAIPVLENASPPEAIDDPRVRSAIVASPDVYGLPVQIRTEEGNLPYSWSGEIDAPPQVQNLGQVVLQDSGVPASLVLARAQMSTSGLVTRLDILCGSPPFEDSVRSSVENLSFVPATSRGLPARAWVLLEFAFLPGNTATQFDPSLADQALESMRENCRKKISAAGG